VLAEFPSAVTTCGAPSTVNLGDVMSKTATFMGTAL
jgi:hypothetical protein